jgi:predicted phage terminase large subunit-like protein
MNRSLTVNRTEMNAVLRGDFPAFIQHSFYLLNPGTEYLHSGYIDVMAAGLEDCRQGRCKRLIINVPPRSLKSHCATVCSPAYLLGHDPSTQIICASYAQELADKHALDCRNLMMSSRYREVFPATRLTSSRPAVHDFQTTRKGTRLATSVGGVLTGRGADFIIIDDPTKPEEALSDVQRRNANEWFDHTLSSRLNSQADGCIIIIMQRLHEDDLVGHVMEQGGWRLLSFPAIAEEEERHEIETPYGTCVYTRKEGEALHPERESLEVLAHIRERMGEYHFFAQYQQSPAPRGGGMVRREWLQIYTTESLPKGFELIFQSWDSANKATELSSYSVCTTWGLKNKKLYLLDVLRRRMDYPELKRQVREQAALYQARVILIEDKASGTQLIQELSQEGVHGITRYAPKMDKVMRLHSVTSTMENGLMYVPEKAPWLEVYLHELVTFPKAKFDDQADSTSQALDWAKERVAEHGLIVHWRQEARTAWARDGRLDEVRALDEKYGPPRDSPAATQNALRDPFASFPPGFSLRP